MSSLWMASMATTAELRSPTFQLDRCSHASTLLTGPERSTPSRSAVYSDASDTPETANDTPSPTMPYLRKKALYRSSTDVGSSGSFDDDDDDDDDDEGG